MKTTANNAVEVSTTTEEVTASMDVVSQSAVETSVLATELHEVVEKFKI
ncbi:hypothetical protein KHA80_09415 [Anaerobacillus sp. HL2]|nr:hypothetical protein KHA80_09415 [Anaerobacillus sp. HL2]